MSKLYDTTQVNVNNLNDVYQKKVNKKYIYTHETYKKNREEYSKTLRYKVTKSTYEVFRYLSDIMRHDDNAPIGSKKVKYKTIQDKLSLGRTTVIRAIKLLQRIGVIDIIPTRGKKGQDVCNAYQLVPFSIFAKKSENELSDKATDAHKKNGYESQNGHAKSDTPHSVNVNNRTPHDNELYNQHKSLPLSFLNKKDTKKYIKDASAPHVIIDNIANVVYQEKSKENKQARKYLQQMLNMAMYLTDDVLDVHDFLITLRHTFIQLHKPHFRHVKNKYGYLASCIIDTLEQTYERGFGLKVKAWFDSLKNKNCGNKSHNTDNPNALAPAFVRKPLVFD